MDLIEVHNRALDQTQMLVDGVEPDQMTRPTPCGEWDVRELLAHMVVGNRSYAGIARRNQRRPDPRDDVLGDDPAVAYRHSAEEVKQAWSDPVLLDQTLPSHLGELPGQTVLGIHLVETVVHGWDLATATGWQTRFDPDIVQAALEISRGVLEEIPRGTWFDPQVEVDDDLPEIDCLAAFLGRSLAGGKT
jgi:uncharacterized protein (TIGR03086 family)